MTRPTASAAARGVAALLAALLTGLLGGMLPVAAASSATAGPAARTAAAAPALAAAPAALSSLATFATADDGRVTFGTQPSSADTPDDRPSYAFAATPGAVFDDHVAIRNYSESPLTLDVYASDAFNTPQGGFDLLPAAEEAVDAGAWVALGQTSVEVPPRAWVTVPFRLTVPPSATPGDHVGGVVASLRTFQTDAQGNRVAVDQRVGTRVYVRVSGDLRPELTVTDVQADIEQQFALRSDVALTYTVRNTGNIRLAGEQVADVRSLFGTRPSAPLDTLPELLPGNEFTVETTVEDVPLAFLLRGGATVDPTPVTVEDAEDDPPPVRGAAFVWVWTWTLALLLVLALGAAAWWWRRRRAQRLARVESAYAALAAQLPATTSGSPSDAGGRS